jgi:hypothetical protein
VQPSTRARRQLAPPASLLRFTAMPSSQTETLPAGARERSRPEPHAGLTAGEAVILAATLAIALLAWAGLALAAAGRYSLPAAAGLTVLASAALGAVAWRFGGRPTLVVDRTELAVLAGIAVVAAMLFFPGFAYGAGKDPGVYVSHAIAISRVGSTSYTDPTLDRSRVPTVEVTREDDAARFPAIWIGDRDTQRIVLQFYHLWPALLASAFEAGGYTGLAQLTPLCGVLSVLVVTLAARRAFGLLVGSLAGLLLATNMLQVWQAKYPSSETFVQLVVGGALLGIVIALQTGWRPAAGLAGLLLGLSYLARPDSLLLILLALGVGGVLIAAGRFDARAAWFGAGLVVTLPYGFHQAYVSARRYTLANHVPDLPVVLAVILGALAVAVLVRRVAPAAGRSAWELLERRQVQRWLGMAVTGMAVVLLVLGFLRPWLFGPVWSDFGGRRVRTYDEETLIRLSWFLTIPGFGLALAGLALVALRRWRAAAWTLILPAMCLLPVYAYRAEVSARLMWWTRRFVPIILPGLVVLIAVALATGLAVTAGPRRLRWPVRAGAAVAAGFLLVVFAGQSLPLRHHNEHGDSFETIQRIASAAGDHQGIFLWEQSSSLYDVAYLFGGPVWLQQGQISALLPDRPDPAYVRSFVRGFPGQPVFLVTKGHGSPKAYVSLGLQAVDRVTYVMPVWRETYTTRPADAVDVPLRFTIWRVGARPAA